MIRLAKTTVSLYVLLAMTGCVVFPLQQDEQPQALNKCPPLPNCASTEASTAVHRIPAFKLKLPLNEAWPLVRQTVAELPRVSIRTEYPGYIYAKSYSKVFKFVDYFEVLAEQDRLRVRSSSLLGISDLGVNKKRTQALREQLQEKGVIE